jgi:hypothetical protein
MMSLRYNGTSERPVVARDKKTAARNAHTDALPIEASRQ